MHLLVFQELSYPDGKVEQIFLDGRRTVVFGNGTRKHQFPDGQTAIRFTNKDIKRFYPCGKPTNFFRPAQPFSDCSWTSKLSRSVCSQDTVNLCCFKVLMLQTRKEKRRIQHDCCRACGVLLL